MLRNLLRTSQYLVRSRINTLAPTVTCHLAQYPIEKTTCSVIIRCCANEVHTLAEIEPIVFDKICNETLESLCEYFEELLERSPNFKGGDVLFSDGVLTVYLGAKYGTYVINRQTPNKQIWLSSPVSGPKRYDLEIQDKTRWVYKHDGVTLHSLVQSEISKICETKVDLTNCAYSSL